MSEAGLFTKRASFDKVLFEPEAIKHHYRRYSMGERDALATQCFQHVESNVLGGKEWAVAMKKEVYRR